MPKNDREYVEARVAEVEEDRRRHPMNAEAIARLIASYSSPDAAVRAAAVTASCPCHVGWDIYEQLRKPALRLRRDPDAKVRALAMHLEEDARQLQAMEATVRWWTDRDEELSDRARDRRDRRGRRVGR